MVTRNSILRSSAPLLCTFAASSFVALALASGCAVEPPDRGDDDDDSGGTSVTAGTSSGGSAGKSSTSGGAGNSTGGVSTSGGAAGSTAGSSSPGGSAPTSGAGGMPGGSSGAGGSTGGSTGGVSTAGGAGGMPGGSGGVGAVGGDTSSGGDAGATGGAGSPGGSGGTGPTGDTYNPDFKEFVGEDCQVSDPQEVNNPKLPDLFEKLDGTRMTTKAEWACRRAELKKIVEKFIHGPKPGKPETVTGTVSATSIAVHVEHMGKSIDFSVQVSIPQGAARPAAAIIGLGGGSLSRTVLTDEGVATINYNNSTLASETSRSGLFTNIYGTGTGASAQVGWAWGVSRIIDVLVAEKEAGRNDIIDPKAIGVTGCSRLGKGAFTIGAFDERIALGIPQESGTGGVSAFRVVNTAPVGPNGKPAQSLNSAWSEAQGWFGTVFGTYKDKVNTIPGDTHSLVAMYAPRGLLVLDNSRIGELGASAQHAASAAGAMVYKALGVESNIEYHGGRPSDPHNHCSFYSEQEEPLRNAIRAFLTHKGEPKGKIEPQPAGTADLDQWIDWDTPTLQ